MKFTSEDDVDEFNLSPNYRSCDRSRCSVQPSEFSPKFPRKSREYSESHLVNLYSFQLVFVTVSDQIAVPPED